MPLVLPTVTLIVHEGVDAVRAIPPLLNSTHGITYKKILVFSPTPPILPESDIPTQHVGHIEFQRDYEGWNRHIASELYRFVPDGHALCIHHDGFVLNASAWEDAFLRYDYIGAPWPREHGYRVGNGGFTLRSAAYLRATAELAVEHNITKFAPEDHEFIRRRGQWLEDKGVRFAPYEMAERFSLEHHPATGTQWYGQFGFHSFKTDISLFYSRNSWAARTPGVHDDIQ